MGTYLRATRFDATARGWMGYNSCQNRLLSVRLYGMEGSRLRNKTHSWIFNQYPSLESGMFEGWKINIIS